MTTGYLEKSYAVLKKVISEGAYVQLALKDISAEKDLSIVTKIVYGTLEQYYLLEYNLSLYLEKKPSKTVYILLLIGSFCLKNLNIPDYTIVNEIVDLTGKIGKKELKPFVNGVLRKISQQQVFHPDESSEYYEEVRYNLPRWIIQLIKKQYPNDYGEILNTDTTQMEHVRLNSTRISKNEFERIVDDFIPSQTGYFVRSTPLIRDLFNKGKLTFQSLASTLVVEAAGNIKGKKVLDLCAAPGGKSVFAAEKGAEVLSCDIHEHRLKLISSYASRMGLDLKTIRNDGRKENIALVNLFDIVFIDAPCSGLGVIKKKQDMIFSKKPEDIETLNTIQGDLLENAKNYIKIGGLIIYSTCTITDEENGKVIRTFLKNNPNYVLDIREGVFPENGFIQLLPDDKGMDGYYIARILKIA